MSVAVSTDRAVREAYESDSSGLHLVPDAVARPESISDVIELVRKAAADRTPVTCAGAQTSTTGASITDKGLLLSLKSMNQIAEFDARTRTVTVGPGCVGRRGKENGCCGRASLRSVIPPARKSRQLEVR